jgi:hypothetical protein
MVTRPEKTPTRPIAEAGRMLTKKIQDSPRDNPARIAGKRPFFTPFIPSASQSIPSANPVLITGRKRAMVLPRMVTLIPNIAAGRVMGTARRENEVRGSYPRQGRATAVSGENPRASMMGGSMVTGVAPMETRSEPIPTLSSMIWSYRSAAITRIYSVMLRIAPAISIMVTWRMVKSTIREMPKEARIPPKDAQSAISRVVLKKVIAIRTVSAHPMNAIRVPDLRKTTSPVKITAMGRMARRKRLYWFIQCNRPMGRIVGPGTT